MVDEETPPDAGAGVDFNAREKSRHLRDKTRQHGNAPLVQAVCETVRQDGVKSRVTEKDLEDALRGRILAEDRIDLLPDRPKHSVLIIARNVAGGGLVQRLPGAARSMHA